VILLIFESYLYDTKPRKSLPGLHLAGFLTSLGICHTIALKPSNINFYCSNQIWKGLKTLLLWKRTIALPKATHKLRSPLGLKI